MAFVNNENDPGQQNQTMGAPTTAQNAPMNQPATSSGGSGMGANAASAQPAQGAKAVPNATTTPPVQNLQSYLQANAPQATGMGQNIASQLTGGYNAVNQDLTNGQQAFDQQVQASAPPANYQQTVQNAASNPSYFASDPSNVANFQAIENASYNGPSSFETDPGYANLNTEIQNAQQNAPDISNPANIEQLVRGQEVNPTAGESNLDTLLLQQSPEGVSAIKSAAAPYANLGNALSNISSTEDANIANTKAATAAAPQYLNNAFLTGPNAVAPAFQNTLNNELQRETADVNTANSSGSSLLQQIQSGGLQNLTPAQLSLLGITSDQLSQLNAGNGFLNSADKNLSFLSGIPQASNPTDFVSQTPVAQPTLANIASPQEYSTEAALSQLLGSGYANPLLDQSQAAQGGTYKEGSPLMFNQDLAKGDIADARNLADWLSTYNPALNETPAYNPAYTYTPSSAATMQKYLNELKTFPDSGMFKEEKEAINDLINNSFGS